MKFETNYKSYENAFDTDCNISASLSGFVVVIATYTSYPSPYL